MSYNILVTGSSGFIGRALITYLRKQHKYTIFGIDRENCDITKDNIVNRNFKHVLHLAGKVNVTESWEQPLEYYKVNTIGTANVLDFCRKYGCSLTYISSYVYGKTAAAKIDENHPVSAVNPYAHSKILAENLCRFYSDNYNVKIAIIRPFNIYGNGQAASFLVPEIISKTLDKRTDAVTVRDLTPKRDYLFIDDFVKLLEKTIGIAKTDVFNAGTGHSISVGQVVKTILSALDIKKRIVSGNITRHNEIMDTVANIGKAQRILQWKPRYSFRQGIQKMLHARA